ncbi:SDR family oxidoreductase, partial [Gordonia sp. GAMMA]
MTSGGGWSPGGAGLGGRVAVVAGATRGIGLAVSYALAGQGVSVVVNGRDGQAVDDTVAEIRGGGGYAVGVRGSAGDDGVAQAMVEAALAEFGALDIAINCAGIAEPPGSTVLTIAPDEFREQIDAHLMSAFHLLQAAGRVFVEQGSGSVVLTGSAASLGMFGGSGYPAAKGGVNALALAAAADLRDQHVRVNVVMPGAKSRLSSGDDYVAHIEGLHRRGILDDPT